LFADIEYGAYGVRYSGSSSSIWRIKSRATRRFREWRGCSLQIIGFRPTSRLGRMIFTILPHLSSKEIHASVSSKTAPQIYTAGFMAERALPNKRLKLAARVVYEMHLSSARRSLSAIR